jgi:DNA-directed RNA polymerase subunit alpha
MNTLNCIESYIDKDKNHYGCFVIEPLEIGQGITLGNALRRTILSELTGYAISGVRINNIKHEFALIEGIKEDVLEIILNLKEIIFKPSWAVNTSQNSKNLKGFLHVKGPIIVTAGMFQLPKNSLSILNPTQYICTIVDHSECYIEIDIEKGKGYKLTEEYRKQRIKQLLFRSKTPSTLFVDSIFLPVRNVNYKIKLIHDTKGNIKESLIFEILTNGSMTPKRCLYEGLKILLSLMSTLFFTSEFFFLSKSIPKLDNIGEK